MKLALVGAIPPPTVSTSRKQRTTLCAHKMKPEISMATSVTGVLFLLFLC